MVVSEDGKMKKLSAENKRAAKFGIELSQNCDYNSLTNIIKFYKIESP